MLITFTETPQTINTIIGTGKRFIAYEIINRLKIIGRLDLLARLSRDVDKSRRTNGKLHNVWESSFDWKECRSKKFILQELNYMHSNPCAKGWNLAENIIDYPHSSALYYLTGVQGIFPVTDWMEIEDLRLLV